MNALSDGATPATAIENLVPAWADCLIRLGVAFARAMELYERSKITLAICLPRIEFSALLVALGTIKWKVSKACPKDDLERLHGLLKKWVLYERNGELRAGVLADVPLERSGFVKILESGGKKAPDFAEMSSEKKKKYKPKPSEGLWRCVESAWWPTIRPIGKEFDERRGVGIDEAAQVAASIKDSGSIEKILGPDADYWLASFQKTEVCIFGCKCRLERELLERIPFADTSGAFNLAAVLRPSCSPDYAVSARTVVYSRAKIGLVDIGGICVIEAGRNLEDNLQASSTSNRVILLARNDPVYEEATQVVKNAFYNRREDALVEYIQPLPYIKILSFGHK